MESHRLQQVQHSLTRIDEFIRAAVARAQSTGDTPTDALRGLIISQDEIEAYVQQPTPLAPAWFDNRAEPLAFQAYDKQDDAPLARLISTFGLTTLDTYILMLCLAPELDRRYERLYAYLQDDVSERRPTVSLMLNLLANTVGERFAVWERLSAEMPLRKHRLVECLSESGRQTPVFLAHYLKADYRVVSYVLGTNQTDERLKHTVRLESYDPNTPLPDNNIEAVRAAFAESPMIYMRGARGMGQIETAAALCASYQLPLLSADVAGLAALEITLEPAWRLALREGYLHNAALLLDGWESALDDHQRVSPAFWDALVDYPYPVFICSQQDWEPHDERRARRLLRMTFSVPAYETRHQVWEQLAASHQARIENGDLEELASKFRFSRSQIIRAINTAADRAASRGEPITKADMYAGAQAHASLRLGHLAQRIVPRYTWDHLILPPDQLAQLREISARMRYAHTVNEEWGFGKRIANRGISALFAGESGTGKTLAAEVIGNELGLVLYKVDLSSVVSKYIGETEKNLSAIFTEAQAGNAILFFDEADALFGKRSEVKDARDRYANIEIAYLLQQIEAYDGVVVLATNFRQNIDEAFTRRLDFLIDFPFPDSPYRQKIWAAHFPPDAPLAADVNLTEIADRYRLSGGNIRNAVVAAAYLAAADGRVINAAHIKGAIRREHQKMGRLLTE